MGEKRASFFLTLFLVWTVAAGCAWGGQVVTEETKSWAKEALQRESELRTTPAPNTVAVLYFSNQTGKSDVDPLQKGFAIMLMTDLSKVKSLQVVERIRLQALIDELALGASGLVEPGTEPRMGRLLGAHWLVGGDIGAPRQAVLQINGDVMDVSPQKELGRTGSEGPLQDIFRMEKEVLFETIALLQVKPTPDEEKALKEPITTSIEALLLLARGVDESDHGHYEKAAELYRGALKLDPQFTVAHLALNELIDLGLVGKTTGKRARDFRRSLRESTSVTDEVTAQEPTRRERQPGVALPRQR